MGSSSGVLTPEAPQRLPVPDIGTPCDLDCNIGMAAGGFDAVAQGAHAVCRP